jgi:hypothetical protein
VSALDAAVDAGTHALGGGSMNAPPAVGTNWAALFLTTAVVAAVIAFIGGVVVAVLNGRFQRTLAALETAMARELTEGTERLRHELADDLAQRTRRADYTRGQIDSLYGPLAFLVESSARHIERNKAIFEAYDDYFVHPRPVEVLEKEIDDTIGRANRYAELVTENNREGIKLLQSAWGWLDIDDIEYMSQYVADVSWQIVEFGEKKPLPPGFYMPGMVDRHLEPPSYLRPEFVERVRKKLREKQRALDAQPAVTTAATIESASQGEGPQKAPTGGPTP